MPAPERDDVALVGLLQRNDADAWESVYRDLYPRLRAYAARRVGEQQAGDVVAETMAKAVASIGRLDATEIGVAPWVFGICRHVVADSFRRAARDQRKPIPAAETVDDVGEAVESHEEKRAMRAAYARLSDDDREILDLRVIAGLSAQEVARVVGRQAGAVRMAQSRALERLRENFKEVYR